MLQKIIFDIGAPHEPKGPRVTWNDIADKMTPIYPERGAKSCRLRCGHIFSAVLVQKRLDMLACECCYFLPLQLKRKL